MKPSYFLQLLYWKIPYLYFQRFLRVHNQIVFIGISNHLIIIGEKHIFLLLLEMI